MLDSPRAFVVDSRPTMHVLHEPKRRTLLLGWRGGVGRAVLALLRGHPRGHEIAASRALLLVDAEGGPDEPLPDGARILAPKRIASAEDLVALVDGQRITEVLELALVDTFSCIEVCAARGVNWLNTSLERWPHDLRSHGALEDAQHLVPGRRPPTTGGSHLVGSGMNPGIVNALFQRAVHTFATTVGVPAEALELYAAFVSEEDTTVSTDVGDGAFAMTWRPESCLAELFVPSALVVENGCVRALDHPPLGARYRVACGRDEVLAHLVPHDELVTLGARHPEIAFAYAYALPPQASRFLAAHPTGDPRDFPLAKLWPPHARALSGRDRVGVLLCSKRFGELWCGFDTAVADALRWGTNATLLQVAAGVLAGWTQLGRRAGVHVVEDLDHDAYLDVACDVLGPIEVVHLSKAPFTPLPDRRV
jgi:hypothetical protein